MLPCAFTAMSFRSGGARTPELHPVPLGPVLRITHCILGLAPRKGEHLRMVTLNGISKSSKYIYLFIYFRKYFFNVYFGLGSFTCITSLKSFFTAPTSSLASLLTQYMRLWFLCSYAAETGLCDSYEKRKNASPEFQKQAAT